MFVYLSQCTVGDSRSGFPATFDITLQIVYQTILFYKTVIRAVKLPLFS
jgi:hypothetical protein